MMFLILIAVLFSFPISAQEVTVQDLQKAMVDEDAPIEITIPENISSDEKLKNGENPNFNSKMSKQELELLEKGEVLIRDIDNIRNISLNMENKHFSKELITSMKKIRPRYLAEVITYIPYDGMEDLPERFDRSLYNASDFTGIPYWSEESQQWFDLFSYAELKDKYSKGNKEFVIVDVVMDPLDVVTGRFEVQKTKSEFLYQAFNETKVTYRKIIECVKPEKMEVAIYVFYDKDSNNWIMYGIGGVRAPRFPIFHKRIMVSFMNRTKSLCMYFLSKL